MLEAGSDLVQNENRNSSTLKNIFLHRKSAQQDPENQLRNDLC